MPPPRRQATSPVLRDRVLSAAVFGPIVVACGYFGHPWFTLLCALALGLGAKEFGELGRRAQQQVSPVLSAAVASALALERGFAGGRYSPFVLATGVLCSAVIYVLVAKPGSRCFEGWAITVTGFVYVGFLGSHLVALRSLPRGIAWLGLAVITIWVSDSSAYFVGRAWGKRRLAPYLSPRKTWEGAVAGALSAVLAAAVIGRIGSLPISASLLSGALMGCLCPFGDLAVSMLKRQVGVKDTSNLIPGHGGVLDRLDTLLFSAPIVYWLAVLA